LPWPTGQFAHHRDHDQDGTAGERTANVAIGEQFRFPRTKGISRITQRGA
jgi:hypothetical protein